MMSRFDFLFKDQQGEKIYTQLFILRVIWSTCVFSAHIVQTTAIINT